MDLEGVDLVQICRTCKCVSPHMRSIFEGYENPHQSPHINDMLMACASVQVMCGDGLPSLICQVCVEQLRSSFIFKRQCEKIDACLRQYIQNVKVNEIKEELQTSDFMGDTVYPCDICNRSFNQEDRLEMHKKIHHNQGLLTIENVDNIENHYYQIDPDANLDFSDHSSVDNCFERESMYEEKIKEEADVGDLAEESNVSEISAAVTVDNDDDNDNSEEKTASENLKVEEAENQMKVKVEEEMISVKEEDDDNIAIPIEVGDQGSGDDDTDSERLSKKFISLKEKRGRDRPCKNPNARPKPPKVKVPGRGGGCSAIKIIKKEEKDEKPSKFPCPGCQEIFNTITQLDKHARQKHKELKVHKCSVCYKEFYRARGLKRHQKIHERQNEFECNICKKTFLFKSSLTKHMDIHSEHSKKHLCSECGQSFFRKDYLNVHMRRHRGEKPFKCKYCGKGFLRSTDVTVHERYHTGEKTHLCTICGKGFGRKYNFMVHMRTHTGEKPYKCTDCDAAFAQVSDFKSHVRLHTGERFQCELCTRSFLKGCVLKHHKRTVHGLNVISNITRLPPVHKQENPDESLFITQPLLKPVVPENIMFVTNDPSGEKIV